jgi:glucosamine-6-phosphate deaminase
VLVKIARDRQGLGNFSGELAAQRLRDLLKTQPRARLVVATGSSQFEVLEVLSKSEGIDWSRVDGFHLDEYLGLDRNHPASFCGYLASRFVDLVPIGSFHFLDGKKDPKEVVEVASRHWRVAPIDLAMIGIGENAHLAFNDPPADFQTREIYHVVTLDEACRKQQVGEGWFSDLDACPSQAISMTIHGILQSKQIICSVPDDRKADAVATSLDGRLSPTVPASILRQHENVTLVLDDASASKLSAATLAKTERV